MRTWRVTPSVLPSAVAAGCDAAGEAGGGEGEGLAAVDLHEGLSADSVMKVSHSDKYAHWETRRLDSAMIAIPIIFVVREPGTGANYGFRRLVPMNSLASVCPSRLESEEIFGANSARAFLAPSCLFMLAMLNHL